MAGEPRTDLAPTFANTGLLTHHDLGCRCYPHVAERDALDAIAAVGLAEYRDGKRAAAPASSAGLDVLRDAIDQLPRWMFAAGMQPKDEWVRYSDVRAALATSTEEPRGSLRQRGAFLVENPDGQREVDRLTGKRLSDESTEEPRAWSANVERLIRTARAYAEAQATPPSRAHSVAVAETMNAVLRAAEAIDLPTADEVLGVLAAPALPVSPTDGLDAALRSDLEVIDASASTAHDYIWGTADVSKEQASAAIWSIHNLVRARLEVTRESE
jgi:hypothetical protein